MQTLLLTIDLEEKVVRMALDIIPKGLTDSLLSSVPLYLQCSINISRVSLFLGP